MKPSASACRSFLYKVTSDAGGAPCVEGGLLTLAICKPAIRSSAAVGDWLFGVGGASLGGRLIYVARVTKKLFNGGYYRRPYLGRRDCVYSWNGNGSVLKIRRDARYHTDGKQAEKDVGRPPEHSRADVLLSEREFRYLGKSGKPIDPARYPRVAKVLSRLRQGHRVNHDAEVAAELARLKDETWASHRKCSVGEPSHPIPTRNGTCSGGERRAASAEVHGDRDQGCV